MYLASNNRKVEEILIQYILQFLHLGFDKILWKLNLSDILQKSPRCRRVCSLEGKYSHFLLFLTSNRFGNFGLFNVDLFLDWDRLQERNHIINSFYQGFSQNKPHLLEQFFFNICFSVSWTKLNKKEYCFQMRFSIDSHQ